MRKDTNEIISDIKTSIVKQREDLALIADKLDSFLVKDEPRVITEEEAYKWVEDNYDEGLYFTGKIGGVKEGDDAIWILARTSQSPSFLANCNQDANPRYAILAKRPEIDPDKALDIGFAVGRFERVKADGSTEYVDAGGGGLMEWASRENHVFSQKWNGYRYRAHKLPELKIKGKVYSGEYRLPKESEWFADVDGDAQPANFDFDKDCQFILKDAPETAEDVLRDMYTFIKDRGMFPHYFERIRKVLNQKEG